jgi:hypothetical protein
MAFNSDEWRPTRAQEKFLALPWTIREAFFGGAAGGGKSDLLLILPLALQLYKNPRFKQLFTRRTFAELKKEIVPRSREIYKKFGASFNQSDMAWTFPREDQSGSGARPDGAMIFFGHIEHIRDVYQYDSMEINLFTPDELQQLERDMYMYIAFSRVRTSDPTLPAIIRAAGMPGNIGHTFVKKRFIDPSPGGETVIISPSGNKRVYIHASFNDNPHIDPGYRQAVEELPEHERRAKKGDWNAFLGQVFDEFRSIQYESEPSNALHVIEPFAIPEWWPRICVGDWGYAAMCWVGHAAISPTGRVYLYDESWWQKVKIAVWGPELKAKLDETPNLKLVKFCQSAGQDRGQEHTLQEEIEKELGRSVELTSNSRGSRVIGKTLLHEYFRWKPKPLPPKDETLVYNEELASHIRRNRGDEAYQIYMKMFQPILPEANLPKLQIFKHCVKVIDAIKACVHDKDKVEDVAEFDGDDPYDGLRYLVDSAERYLKTSQFEQKKNEEKEHVLKLLEESKDWTAFYRRMEHLERKNPTQIVKRYARRH